jgi:hypothetical protein
MASRQEMTMGKGSAAAARRCSGHSPATTADTEAGGVDACRRACVQADAKLCYALSLSLSLSL